MTHHPHIHFIVPGGGISPDGGRWVSCRPGFFLPVRVLSRLFRRLFLENLIVAHEAGRLFFFNDLAHLHDGEAFASYLVPLRKIEWVVYAKKPFAGPKKPVAGPNEVLRYLARYTHRVAISNRRLIALDDNGVTFKYKDYRINGPGRYTTMKLSTHEFMRRFLMHVLPSGFHRIRHEACPGPDPGAFSPMVDVRRTWPEPASCCTCRRLRTSRRRATPATTRLCRRCRSPVPAAAAAWSSSRHWSPTMPHVRRRSATPGPAPHDPHQVSRRPVINSNCGAPMPPVLDRPRHCFAEPATIYRPPDQMRPDQPDRGTPKPVARTLQRPSPV